MKAAIAVVADGAEDGEFPARWAHCGRAAFVALAGLYHFTMIVSLPHECSMTYMYPSYTRVPLGLPVSSATDAADALDYAVLTNDERAELVELVETAVSHSEVAGRNPG